MKLGVLLIPLVAVTAAGWLGVEGYYLTTGNCPLSGCSTDEGAVAAPVTLATSPAPAGGDACCPTEAPAVIPVALGTTPHGSEGALGAPAHGSDGALAPGALAPKAHASSDDACCPMTPPAAVVPAGTTPAAHPDGCVPGEDCPPSDCVPGEDCPPSDCVPGEDCAPGKAAAKEQCTEKTGCEAAQATGLETPSAAMDCGPTDCDDGEGCCSGEANVAPVDRQAPAAE